MPGGKIRACTLKSSKVHPAFGPMFMEPLLRSGISYDPQSAGSYIKTNLLSLLPK
jgi:hypothetical protein